MTSERPEIAVIILTINQKDKTLRCLESFRAVHRPPYRIFLWDNGSADGTLDAVRALFPDVALAASPHNLGVASGRNAAAELAISKLDPAYLFFIDNDMTVSPGFLSVLHAPFAEDQRLAQTTGKIAWQSDEADSGAGPRVIYGAGGVPGQLLARRYEPCRIRRGRQGPVRRPRGVYRERRLHARAYLRIPGVGRLRSLVRSLWTGGSGFWPPSLQKGLPQPIHARCAGLSRRPTRTKLRGWSIHKGICFEQDEDMAGLHETACVPARETWVLPHRWALSADTPGVPRRTARKYRCAKGPGRRHRRRTETLTRPVLQLTASPSWHRSRLHNLVQLSYWTAWKTLVMVK